MEMLVCGGRDYADKEKVFKVLNLLSPDDYYDEINDRWVIPLTIIEGGAAGADLFAKQWAEKNKVKYIEHPADWNKHGKAAGPIRNQEMLDKYHPDIVVAFKGGKGTQDMINKALKKGIIVLRVEE